MANCASIFKKVGTASGFCRGWITTWNTLFKPSRTKTRFVNIFHYLQATMKMSVFVFQMLTQQLQSSNNRQEFRSIPSDLLNLPSPNKLDDGFINQLLESATERPKKPLTELQKCLNALKKEMSSLQEEIVEKSLVTLNSWCLVCCSNRWIGFN